MSILNGAVHKSVIRPEPSPLGERLETAGFWPECGAFDGAKLDDTHLLVACSGSVAVYAVSESVQKCGELIGIGEARQIAVYKGFAYITARADGLYVCDFRDIAHPKVCGHIDTVELATGVCAADGLLAVVSRHMGCELFSLAEPEKPVRLTHFFCGEAQSVWLCADLLLIGDWMNRRVQIFSLSDGTPRLLSMYTVDGYADGICTFSRGGRRFCLIASGHHANRLKNRCKYAESDFVTPEMIAEGYGGGHGVTLVDITHPEQPEFCDEWKAPPLFGGIDTWRVRTDGKKAYYADSMNGAFVLEITEDLRLMPKHYLRLPPLRAEKHPVPPTVQSPAEQVTGLASVGGRLFLCSPQGGVYQPRLAVGDFLPPSCTAQVKPTESDVIRLHHAVKCNNTAFAAAGNNGICTLRADGTAEKRHETAGICHDILALDGFLLCAEGDEGLAVYRAEGARLNEVSRLRFPIGQSPRELVSNGTIILAQLGSFFVGAFRLTAEGKLVQCGESFRTGILYYRHLSRTFAGDFGVMTTIATGPALLQADGSGIRQAAAWNRSTCPFDEGACGCGEKLIAVLQEKYLCLDDPLKLAHCTENDLRPVDGAELRGQPFVCGDRLAILNRCTGTVEELDISDPHQPRFLARYRKNLPESVAALFGQMRIFP